MFTCVSCGAQAEAAISCPNCGRQYCAVCYAGHAKEEKRIPWPQPRFFKDTQDDYHRILSPREQILHVAHQKQERYRKGATSTLGDTEGTPTPAATTPFAYRSGGGSPDEPPEGAGAPNTPQIAAASKQSHSKTE